MWNATRAAALAATLISAAQTARAEQVIIANDKPIYKIGFAALSAAAEQATGITLHFDTYQPTDKYIATIEASVAANALPPLFTWWNGTNLREIVASGRITPLDTEWDAAIKSGTFSRDTANLFTTGGHVWGMSLGTGRWVVFYNKKLFAKAGIATAPATWPEFLEDAAKLKAAGITPISATLQSGWRAFTWFEEIMLRTDPDAFAGLFTGKTPYDGPAVQNTFRIWGELYAKGYMTDPRSNQDVVDYAAGKGAMYLMGDWVVGALANAGLTDDDLGVFIMPMINPSARDSIIVDASPILVTKQTANRPEVRKMIAYLMSTDAANVLRDKQGLYIANLKSTPSSKLIATINTLIAQRHAVSVTRWQEATAPELQGDLIAEFGKFMLDPTPANATKVMANLQTLNKTYWDSH